MSDAQRPGLSPVKQALVEIRRLKEELARERARQSEPIAIVGIGVRFPGGADTPEKFWELLQSGTNAVGPVPAGRWSHEQYFDASGERPDSYYVQHGGFLENVDAFDPEFFGIAPLEAETMDPQQRLMLETAWEALEDAGISAASLHGSSTGVFVGIGTADYHRMVMADADRVDAYASSGTAFSVAAGRISYLLGLHGPALSIDTACSSSLVAVHLACSSLRRGETDVALAGGVNLMLSPEITVDFCSAGMLSRDGMCRTFAAGADGYVRSEGCGVVVLKRLSDAEAAGDRVLAVVRGTAVNQDGRSSGLTAPNGPAQEAVVRSALRDAGMQPSDISYVEAHGTGTSLGDPIEVQALGAVFGESPRPAPLLIGSVKTNLGHLEAAAGMAGLIKAVETVRRGVVPPHLHFAQPNPHIAWERYPLAVPTTSTPLPAGTPARAGVSSFGFSGTNAHVIVEAPPEHVAQAAESGAWHVLTLSAPQESGLRALATRYAAFLKTSTDAFRDICATANAGRSMFDHRIALIARNAGEAAAALNAWIAGASADNLWSGVSTAPVAGAFVFGDQASGGWPWLRVYPSARAALDECDAVAASVGVSDSAADGLAAQHAAAALVRALGVEPAIVLGNGTGGVVAAHEAGLLTLHEALRVAAGGTPVALHDSAREHGTVSLAESLEAARAARASWFVHFDGSPDGASTPVAEQSAIEGEVAVAISSDDMSLPSALAQLFVAGLRPDWRALAPVYARVTLPAYPFQRRRFWFTSRADARPSSASHRGAPASASIPSAAYAAAVTAGIERSALAPIDVRIAEYGTVWSALEDLTNDVGQNTLAELGAFRGTGPLSVDEVLAQAGIGSLYEPIVRRWLDALVQRGVLARTEAGYAGAPQPIDTTDSWSRVRALLAQDPALLRYLEHSVPLVPGVLSGQVSPLDTLFPEGSFDMAADLYENSAVLRYVNGIAAAALRAFAAARPADETIRVIEVGAGTGGSTSSLVSVLPRDRATYTYTDVSDVFLRYGREKFAAVPFLETAILDLEQDPAAQGFRPGTFDVVVGSNVLHAARDLRAALERVRSLLTPGGMLMLVESTGHHAWHDVSTGLIEGWQHFADDLRADTPLLPAATWLRVLREAGFDDAAALPSDDSPAAVLRQNVIVAYTSAAPIQGADTGTGAGTRAEAPASDGATRAGAPSALGAPHAGSQGAPHVAAQSAPRTAAAPAVVPAAIASPAGEESAFVASLRAAIGSEREDLAANAVRDCVMEVLRSDPDRPPARDARLMDLGLDSLMAVRLRNLLQKKLGLPRKLPATLVFDYPTIRQIAGLVVTTALGAPKSASQPEPPKEEHAGSREAAVAAMSDAEVEAMLERLQAEGLS